jgi:hypothetical protein
MKLVIGLVGAALFMAAGSKPGRKLDVKRRMSNAGLRPVWAHKRA